MIRWLLPRVIAILSAAIIFEMGVNYGHSAVCYFR